MFAVYSAKAPRHLYPADINRSYWGKCLELYPVQYPSKQVPGLSRDVLPVPVVGYPFFQAHRYPDNMQRCLRAY